MQSFVRHHHAVGIEPSHCVVGGCSEREGLVSVGQIEQPRPHVGPCTPSMHGSHQIGWSVHTEHARESPNQVVSARRACTGVTKSGGQCTPSTHGSHQIRWLVHTEHARESPNQVVSAHRACTGVTKSGGQCTQSMHGSHQIRWSVHAEHARESPNQVVSAHRACMGVTKSGGQCTPSMRALTSLNEIEVWSFDARVPLNAKFEG